LKDNLGPGIISLFEGLTSVKFLEKLVNWFGQLRFDPLKTRNKNYLGYATPDGTGNGQI
jgi:hypothetical protein